MAEKTGPFPSLQGLQTTKPEGPGPLPTTPVEGHRQYHLAEESLHRNSHHTPGTANGSPVHRRQRWAVLRGAPFPSLPSVTSTTSVTDARVSPNI